MGTSVHRGSRPAIGVMSAMSAMVAVSVFTAPASAGEHLDLMGFDALSARLGLDRPTGEGVAVATVELATDGSYGPDPNDGQLDEKNFIPMSGDPGPGNLHALLVARFQYGTFWSFAKDVQDIYLYEAVDFLLDVLNTGQSNSTPPDFLPAEIKLLNNSWIADLGVHETDNAALRRADRVVNRDDIVMTSGMPNNGDAALPIMWHAYNGLAVGVRTGIHVANDTDGAHDGPGRMKPEVVAPHDQFTSYATPMVNAVGSLLVETARTWPTLASNPRAERSVVLKAAIISGAKHEDIADGQWSNNPVVAGPDRGRTARPLDDVVGAGTVNIDRSHLILTGAEQDAASAPPALANAARLGWDLVSIPRETSVYYRFHLTDTADEVSIAATWHRDIRLAANFWSLADIDLILHRVGPTGSLESLVGAAGKPFFARGNVVSESAVDNVEHLYLNDLARGDYVLEVARVDNLAQNQNWDVAVAWILPEPVLPILPEDIDGSGLVDFNDLLFLLVAWGDCPEIGACPEDINADGTIDFADLLALLAAWGEGG